MRYLLATGIKIKSLYTRQKTSEQDPHIDVSLTVKNFTEEKKFKESQAYPEAIEHGVKEEENAKFYYSKLSEKKHCSFDLKEPGLLIGNYFLIFILNVRQTPAKQHGFVQLVNLLNRRVPVLKME